ncbi:hypothetical protein DM49_2420 [Burkholderia mallei]|nr:hypothetical protein DM75_288 [Burkholderia mallei]KOS91019.1 hypothetical protein DM49_2420 [Burkholderia mallei]
MLGRRARRRSTARAAGRRATGGQPAGSRRAAGGRRGRRRGGIRPRVDAARRRGRLPIGVRDAGQARRADARVSPGQRQSVIRRAEGHAAQIADGEPLTRRVAALEAPHARGKCKEKNRARARRPRSPAARPLVRKTDILCEANANASAGAAANAGGPAAHHVAGHARGARGRCRPNGRRARCAPERGITRATTALPASRRSARAIRARALPNSDAC